MNEACFKYWKNHRARKEYSKNPGTFTMHLWEQDLASNSLFVHDLEHIPMRVREHNERRLKRFNGSQSDVANDVREQSLNIGWEDGNMGKMERLRKDLVAYININPAKCGVTKGEIHASLKSFFEKQKPKVKFVAKDTFSNFLSGTTKHPRFNQHQVNTFVEFMRDDDVVKSDQLVEVNDNLGNKLETGLLIVDDVTDTVMDDVDNSVTSAPAIENIVNNRKEPVKVSPFDFIAETCHSYDDDDEATESNNEITDYELDGDNDSFVRLVDDEKQNVDDWLPDVDPRVGVTMHDYPAYGNLAARVGFYREKWDVLSSYKQIPKRVRDEIMLHAKKCISDKEYGSDWASVIKTPSTRIELTEEECEGEDPYVPVRDEIVRDR